MRVARNGATKARLSRRISLSQITQVETSIMQIRRSNYGMRLRNMGTLWPVSTLRLEGARIDYVDQVDTSVMVAAFTGNPQREPLKSMAVSSIYGSGFPASQP